MSLGLVLLEEKMFTQSADIKTVQVALIVALTVTVTINYRYQDNKVLGNHVHNLQLRGLYGTTSKS